MSIANGHFWIGTSNGYMPGNRSTFPPEYQLKSRLHYYSTIFNSIEVNSCFYKTPLKSTLEKLTREVPDDFRFTLKFCKEVTHVKDLKYDLSQAEKFLKAAEGIGNKKGCLLIQFPGKINIKYFNEVEQILKEIQLYDPNNEWKKAIEFRNEDWYIGETTELLNEYDATMVMHDFSKAKIATVNTKSNFLLIRFHGPTGNYRDSYSDQALGKKAEQIAEFLQTGKEVYAYFNNTIGNAFENARTLQKLVNMRLIL